MSARVAPGNRCRLWLGEVGRFIFGVGNSATADKGVEQYPERRFAPLSTNRKEIVVQPSQEERAEKALEQRARRAAKRAGLVAMKSRKGLLTIDNYGGFMLVHAHMNIIVAGQRFDMSAQEVIEYCTE